ncbi:MAG TPA: glycine betaine ABC transporter substrate-binding protein [Bryobacteraceae bacterium]|nr:glycine betaine ABC transporter substrate-binding protein [Bryobacteraceae bacterium]
MDRTPLLLLTALPTLIAVLTGCAAQPHVTVGSKNFTEQMVLGEIVAQQIERRMGLEVERKFGLGGTLLAQEALRTGGIDLYPEYTGTALTAVLKQPAVKDARAAFTQVAAGYRQWGVEWLPPLGFNNSFAMVVRTQDARAQNLKTLSDAAHRPGPWHMGAGYEFMQRPDGLDGLVRTYGLRMDGAPVTMDLGLLYQALSSKKVDIAAGSATDGMLAHEEFTILDDDLHYFPPYECALAVRTDAERRFPELRKVLMELSGRIPEKEMRRMNELVDVEHKPIAEVARNFIATLK